MLLSMPITIKNLTIDNRIVMPPMATYLSPDGSVTPEICTHYCSRAQAGTGLIIVEHSFIDMRGRANPHQLSVASDAMLPGLSELAKRVHATGKTKIFVQINHAGSQTDPQATGGELVSASAIPHPALKEAVVPRALTKEEIAHLRRLFAESASRVKKAGFDGVEIHAAHGYLLNQFYSPLTNSRQDAYGGTLEKRLRFVLEVLAAVRAEVGNDFPIAVRLGGSDYMEGGNTIDESVAASELLAAHGADLLDITGGMCRYTRKDTKEPGYFSDMTNAIKKKVALPVILTGGITTAAQAEFFLNAKSADMIGVGRAMLKNADWSKQALD